MESFVIGINVLDSFPGDCYRAESLKKQDKGIIDLTNTSFLRDYSLFGNDSEDSDFDEMDMIVKDFNLPFTETTKVTGNLNKPKVFCCLKGEELIYEADGEVSVLCVRMLKNSEPKILTTLTQDGRGNLKKVKIEENDLLIVVAGKICKEDIMKVIKKGIAKNRLIPRNVLNEVTNNIKARNKEGIIIVAKISREI